MIYITGDTHIPIDVHKLNATNFNEQKKLTREDYIIICGDFGGVWNNSREDLYWLKWLNKRNFTTLFVDGNHENFDLLNNDFEVVDFFGGKAHKIRDNIYHLMRGEVFNLPTHDDSASEKYYKIFVMGGAQSHDKEQRTEGKTWWREELPNAQEYANAEANLAKNNYIVDYVLTHCCPTFIQTNLKNDYPANELTNFLEKVALNTAFKKWYFGHYHTNKKIEVYGDKEYFAIYSKIVKLP